MKTNEDSRKNYWRIQRKKRIQDLGLKLFVAIAFIGVCVLLSAR